MAAGSAAPFAQSPCGSPRVGPWPDHPLIAGRIAMPLTVSMVRRLAAGGEPVEPARLALAGCATRRSGCGRSRRHRSAGHGRRRARRPARCSARRRCDRDRRPCRSRPTREWCWRWLRPRAPHGPAASCSRTGRAAELVRSVGQPNRVTSAGWSPVRIPPSVRMTSDSATRQSAAPRSPAGRSGGLPAAPRRRPLRIAWHRPGTGLPLCCGVLLRLELGRERVGAGRQPAGGDEPGRGGEARRT